MSFGLLTFLLLRLRAVAVEVSILFAVVVGSSFELAFALMLLFTNLAG